MSKTTVITIANQKGGTGKTITAYNLAYALSIEGKKLSQTFLNQSFPS
ncbi:AAA family ATPase [Paenibacillus macerans]